MVEEGMTVNRNSSANRAYATIKLNEDGSCPFLTDQNWCKIQLNLGEEYISDVCFFYPRITNLINGKFEKSITVSCPEAARRVLLNAEGITFNQFEVPFGQRTLITANNRTPNLKAEPFLWELRFFTIQLLQNRDYGIADRLIILGMFCLDVQECLEKEESGRIPGLINSYVHSLTTEELKVPLAEIPVNFRTQSELLQFLTETLVPKKKQRYAGCYNRLRESLGLENGSTEEIAERYRDAYQNYYHPFMKENEYLLENYLVNYVFSNVFPCGLLPTVYDEYIALAVYYSLIKYHLIGMAGFHQGLNYDIVIELVQSFSRSFGHSREALNTLLEFLNRTGFIKMSDMMLLIKN
ncbi:MAG: lysine-N-methylase [Nitrospiraceae bacterium]|nr:MAG: lysine-N-methylase [Nitrospiraceae bacterium]